MGALRGLRAANDLLEGSRMIRDSRDDWVLVDASLRFGLLKIPGEREAIDQSPAFSLATHDDAAGSDFISSRRHSSSLAKKH